MLISRGWKSWTSHPAQAIAVVWSLVTIRIGQRNTKKHPHGPPVCRSILYPPVEGQILLMIRVNYRCCYGESFSCHLISWHKETWRALWSWQKHSFPGFQGILLHRFRILLGSFHPAFTKGAPRAAFFRSLENESGFLFAGRWTINLCFGLRTGIAMLSLKHAL